MSLSVPVILIRVSKFKNVACYHDAASKLAVCVCCLPPSYIARVRTCMHVHVHVDEPLYGVRDTLTACTRHNHGEESAAFLPTPPHVHSVTIRSPARLSPTFARNFDLNLFKGCITRSRFSFLERSCLPARGARTLPCEPPAIRCGCEIFPLPRRHPFSFPPFISYGRFCFFSFFPFP